MDLLDRKWLNRKGMMRYLDGRKLDKHGREIDSRRSNFYEAESLLEDWLSEFDDHEIDRFVSKKHVRNRTDYLTGLEWWKKRYPEVREVTVEFRPGQARKSVAYRNSNRIRFEKLDSEDPLTQIELVHELLHLTVPDPHAAHGRLFARRYLDAVNFRFDDEAASKLEEFFEESNVKYEARREVPENRWKEAAVASA